MADDVAGETFRFTIMIPEWDTSITGYEWWNDCIVDVEVPIAAKAETADIKK
jgi:hypothetical protein